MCKFTNTQPSYLIHPLDLIGGDKVPELSFFPGMNIRSERKLEVFKISIQRVSERRIMNWLKTGILDFSNTLSGNLKVIQLRR